MSRSSMEPLDQNQAALWLRVAPQAGRSPGFAKAQSGGHQGTDSVGPWHREGQQTRSPQA